MLSIVRKTLSIQRSGFGVTKRGKGDTEKNALFNRQRKIYFVSSIERINSM